LTSKFGSGDRTFAAGRHLLALGEPCDAIYHLLDGWVCLYKLLDDGRRQVLQFALPGAVLGFPPTKRGLTYGAQALTSGTVCVIPRDNLSAMFGKHPEMAMRMVCLVSRDRSLAYDRLSGVGRRTARQRVAHLFLELFVRSRMQWPGHHAEEMHLPLTQELIGDATGLTGVHVNRVLRSLRQEGIVEFHYRRLRIMNPDGLLDVAGVTPRLMFPWLSQDE
jgi:CRP-like cAMP-binding protein